LEYLGGIEKVAFEAAVAAGLTPEAWYDVVDADEYLTEPGLINFLTLKSSKEVEYLGIEVDEAPTPTFDTNAGISTDPNFVHATISTAAPFYLAGGTDGDESLEAYEAQVVAHLRDYNDPDSQLQEIGLNLETIMYDTGFTFDTKKAFINFIKIRRNTMIGLSTFIENKYDKPLTIAEEIAYGALLKNLLKLAPESTEFGTPVMRGFISAGSMDLIDGTYPRRVSTVFEIADKLSKRAGRGDGKFSANDKFDRIPGNFLTLGKNVKPEFIPNSIKNKMWQTGLIWPQAYDRVQYFFPAFQTVYSDDTSVLNNIETVLAICTIHTVNDWAWKHFTGTTSLTENSFKEAVEAFVTKNLKNRFDGQYYITPTVYLTEGDRQRGYAWHLMVEIYANNMKTVMTSKVVARRMSDITNG
jgi:hypothetical protein